MFCQEPIQELGAAAYIKLESCKEELSQRQQICSVAIKDMLIKAPR